LWAIAEGMAKAGMKERAKEVFDKALQVVEGIEDKEDEIEQAEALREIAEEMAEAGMFDQALKVAERIEWAEEREEALRTIARKMAEARMFDQALKVAERIENALWGGVAGKGIGRDCGRDGEDKDA
jgi:tetratricopeptide (TPR) repeat protein